MFLSTRKVDIIYPTVNEDIKKSGFDKREGRWFRLEYLLISVIVTREGRNLPTS